MKNKKIIALLLVLVLTFVAVGCATQPTPQPLAPPASQNEYEYEDDYDYYDEYEEEYESERYNELEFSDENVKLTVSFDRPQYTHNDIEGMTATITNIGEEIVVFTKGSGSNRVPDAIVVELGHLTPLFHPGMMTMDLQTEQLEPGQSVTFELPFAPYMYYADTDAEFASPIGFDRDIEFFQSDEWVRVQSGEIAGTISFSYVLRSEEDEFFMIVEGDEILVLEGSFTVNLGENGAEAAEQTEAENGDTVTDDNGETTEEEQA